VTARTWHVQPSAATPNRLKHLPNGFITQTPRFAHPYAVLRHDDFQPTDAKPHVTMTVTKVFADQTQAQQEAERRNLHFPAARRRRYVLGASDTIRVTQLTHS
jgi:hypothetical protein